MLSFLAISSSAEVGKHVPSHFVLSPEVGVVSGNGNEHAVSAMEEGEIADKGISTPKKIPTAKDFPDVVVIKVFSNDMQATNAPTKDSKQSLTGFASAHRRAADVEELLMDISTRDPSQWSATEWLLMIIFLSFFGWLGCCMLTLCCCGGGGGGGSELIRCLCLYEICCRGGADIDECCYQVC